MKTVGIICEYNPIHYGHVYHISETRRVFGEECDIVCAMSGNFVQRGEFAAFEKHARAEAAVKSGADLVLELPLFSALSSAEGFARGGVALLDSLGICTHLSFGIESENPDELKKIADCLVSPEIDGLIKTELSKGMSFAAARQKAAEKLIGEKAMAIQTPNNILAVEYLKALTFLQSGLIPISVTRQGGEHGGKDGLSSTALRNELFAGNSPWNSMPYDAAEVFKKEIEAGRGPVCVETCETAFLARLRSMSSEEYVSLPDATEGLGKRLEKFAKTGQTLEMILDMAKTKRYALSRLRRMILCAYLGITDTDIKKQPEYIKVLALNGKGRKLLKQAGAKCRLPIITKPASALTLEEKALEIFRKEAESTDLYALAYPNKEQRFGGQEYKMSPVVVKG